MKKITKTNLHGLRQLSPVLGKEEMQCHVGGNSDAYYGNDWLNHGFGGYDSDGNYTWHSGYTKDEFDNWEGPWYGGWVYGLGYVYPDANIYGYQGGAGSGYYGFGYYGYGYDDNGYYGYGDNGGSNDGNKRGDIIKSDWACMFNCMNFINSSKSAEEYYKLFIGGYKDVDPIKDGGLTEANRIKALEVCGFSFEEVNTVFYDGGSGIVQLVIFDMDDLQGRTHAGIVTGKTEDGYTIIYDPTIGKSYNINFARIATVYRVKKE